MPIPMSLQPLLRQPYSRDTYRTILEDILPSGTLQLLQTPQPIVARCDDVTSTDQIGTIELPDGNTIALLEVHVADQIKLARNRVALRNFVARFIDEASTTAVLAVFHQPGKPDWRLTYACKRSQLDDDTLEITSTQTAPRRYTFLLGENEPCRTAAGRLAELREKDEHLTLEEVEKAFSVERLNKDFFKDYKKHYETFTAHLLAPENAKATRTAFGIEKHAEEADQDKADKPIRDFVKRLLGRLVFLHFLQKKGWMGCPAKSKAWTGGDPDFLASYFAHAESKKDAHRFHSHWLIPLFFDALNNAERPGDLFPPTSTRIPYLNGGLFETDPAPLHALDFPAEQFRALLEFFGQYHFTIDENDPEDHEVGIDPEMLGHIFENLLEDNKDKGAYYTPKAIVSYMARQSLLHYLQTHLGENAELAVLLNEKDTAKHTDKDSFVRINAKRIADLLDAVKICDPAIGSGAFPIGVLQEILWTRLTLNWELNTPEERAALKRRIIQNSIHGVDLDPGAVEIARLRFWLALVVDEEQPRPLPNLDYKIHRADSLIEYIRGEPVHLGKVSAEDKRTHGAIQSLIAAKAALFTAQKLADKRAARFALYRALAEVAMAEFTWLRNDMGLIANDAERAAQLDHGLKEFGHRIKLIDSVAKESTKIQDHVLTELRAWFDDDKNPTFLWQLHFGEVFAQGGFDIVIQNPPYVAHEHHSPQLKRTAKDVFRAFDPFADLYCYFIELAAKLCKPGATTVNLTSNSFLRADYGKPLRRFITSETQLREVISIDRSQVFESAIVNVAITTFAPIPTKIAGTTASPVQVCSRSLEMTSLWSHMVEFSYELPLECFPSEGWSLAPMALHKIAAKIRSTGTSVQDMQCKIRLGIATGHNGAFLLDADKAKSIISKHSKYSDVLKPVLRGRSVDRFIHGEPDQFLILSKNGVNLPRDFPILGNHLETFGSKFKQRGAQGQEWWNLRACSFYDDFEKDRVVWIELTDVPKFAVCRKGTYLLNTAYFVLPPDDWPAQAMTALFNSKTTHFFIFLTAQTSGMGTSRWFKEYVELIPIPTATPADKARLSQLAEACAAAAQRGDEATVAVHEAEIDQIVYRLFDLTPDEIALIESALAPTRSTSPKRKRASS